VDLLTFPRQLFTSSRFNSVLKTLYGKVQQNLTYVFMFSCRVSRTPFLCWFACHAECRDFCHA